MRIFVEHVRGRGSAKQLVLAVAVSGVLLAGCSSSSDSGAASHVTTTASTSSSSASVASHGGSTSADTWVPVTDAEYGLTFSMPTAAKESTSTQPGGANGSVTVKTYSADVSDDVGDALSIFPVRVTNIDAYADSYIDAFVSRFRSAGATDVAVSNRRDLAVDHHPAVDLQVSFTAKDGTKPAWLISFVSAPSALLIIQCFDSSPVASLSALRDQQTRIQDSIRLR